MKPDDFIKAFNQLRFYFIHDTEFNSPLQLFPYEINEPIKYPLDCSRQNHLDEPKATPFLIKGLEEVLKYELKTFEYKIKNVCSGNKCVFTIPLDEFKEIKV